MFLLRAHPAASYMESESIHINGTHTSSGHPAQRRKLRHKPSGAVVLEVLLALPLVLIALLAIIEFGLLWSNMQAVEMAARSGSQVATRYPVLPNGGAVPADVVTAVADELARIGV